MKFKGTLGRWFLVTALAFGYLAGGAVHAQEFPSRLVRFVVPYSPGSATDRLARLLAQELSAKWKNGVVVENVVGAGGTVGTRRIAEASPDGHTLGFIASNFTISAALYPNLPYNSLEGFTPVMQLGYTQLIVAGPVSGAASMEALMRQAKAAPGSVNFASTGNGSLGHLVLQMLSSTTDAQYVHVPYRDVGQLAPDLMSGKVSLGVTGLAALKGLVDGGKLRGLAVTAPKRSVLMPSVPAMSELVPGFDVTPWIGIVAPKGMPAAASRSIQASIADVMKTPEFQKGMLEIGVEADLLRSDQFWGRVRNEVVKWQRVLKESGATIN